MIRAPVRSRLGARLAWFLVPALQAEGSQGQCSTSFAGFTSAPALKAVVADAVCPAAQHLADELLLAGPAKRAWRFHYPAGRAPWLDQ